jgi:hypothetical protein
MPFVASAHRLPGLTGASEVVAKTKFDAGGCASLLQFLHVRNGGRIAKRTLAL